MKKLSCLKGKTGLMLREARDTYEGPFTVKLEYVSSAFIANPTGFALSVTVRGNSKQRRQQARQLERWFNEGCSHVPTTTA